MTTYTISLPIKSRNAVILYFRILFIHDLSPGV